MTWSPPAPVPVRPGPARRASRVVGVDVARGLAVVGMFAAHLWPRDVLDERLFDGRSAILFATLAGVGLGLLTGGARPVGADRRPRLVAAVAVRASVLVVLGLALQVWNPWVLVILPYYGVMFVLLLPLLFAPRWVVAAAGALLVVVCPWLVGLVPVDAYGSTTLPGGAGILSDALLVGSYPALVWLPFLCAGLVAARSDLRRPGVQLALVAGGALAALVGYGARLLPGAAGLTVLDPAAHEGMPAEVVGSGGVALAVLGALLWLTDPARGRAGDRLRLVLHPLAATGAQPLTVYSAHLLLTAPLFLLAEGTGTVYGLPLGWLVASVVLTLAYAVAWQRWLGRGPVERVVALLTAPLTRPPAPVARPGQHGPVTGGPGMTG